MDTLPDETGPSSLERNWLYKLAVLSDRIARHTGQVAARMADLNLSQWRVLVAIADRDGRFASEVVDLTPMDKGIVSRAVNHLVARGHLLRRPSPHDARRAHLHLTPEGLRVFELISGELLRSGAASETLLPPRDADRLGQLIDAVLDVYPGSGPCEEG
ncbi:MAG: MarR family winged helix-turn-helix transcriptional regulator [Pseudomonadota bacterium]